MRVSVKKNDPGYSNYSHRFKVFLNGEELKYCFTADEELGMVWVHDIEKFRADVDKNKFLKHDKNGNITNRVDIKSKVLIGNVEIRK